MVRSALGKVAWVGRTASMVFGLALVMALVIGAASTAWSATGGNFILGKANAADRVSKLTASIAGPALTLVNQSTGAAATALNLNVAEDKPPLRVNAAAGTATNLSADELDGKSSEQFANVAHPHSGADITSGTVAEARIDGTVTRDGEVMPTVKANDGVGSGVDADTIDGQNSSAFAPSSHSHDDRYYTESEVNTALSGKANTTHQHSGAEITSGTVAEARIDNSIARDNEVANGFIQGRGIARHAAEAMAPDGSFYNIFFELPDPGLFLSYKCPTDLTTNGWLRIRNTGSETVNVFSDNGSTNPNHFGELAPNGAFEQNAAASGEYITLQVQGSSVTTIDVFSAHRSSNCHVQSQALVTKP